MGENRNMIMEAALKVLQQHGYEKASLADVAKHVRKSRTSLYKYFRNKEDLFESALAYNSADHFGEFDKILLSKKSAVEKFKKYNIVKFNFIRDAYERFVLLNKEITCNPVLREIIMKTNGKKEISVISKIILDGIKNGEFRVLTPKRAKLTASVFFSMTAAIVYDLYEKDNMENFTPSCHIIEEMFLNSLIK